MIDLIQLSNLWQTLQQFPNCTTYEQPITGFAIALADNET
jgi:hypothetical protein